MDEFLNLGWSWRTSRFVREPCEPDFSYDEKDVFMCHLNEIDHIHLLDDYGKSDSEQHHHQYIDPRTGKEVTRHFEDHSRRKTRPQLFKKFPQRSAMNSHQHLSCLNALRKLKADHSIVSMSDREDIRTYSQLYKERSLEKTKFYEFVKSEFINRNIKNCYNLNLELEKFISKRMKDEIKKIKASNDNCYQLQSAIPLREATDKISIEFEKTLCESGVVLAINRNKYSNPLQMSCQFLNNFFPNDVQDHIPLELWLNENIDIVVSSSTLSSLLNYSKDLTKNWSVTFSIKEFNAKKTIIFNEMLPMPFEYLEKNRRAYKYGLTASISVPKKSCVFSLKNKCVVHHEQPTFNEHPPSILSFDPVSTFKALPFDEYLKKIDLNSLASPTSNTSNCSHRLWKVNRNDNEHWRLLISSSQDVCETQSNDSVQFINLSPKLDYQSEFGAEQMRFSELISEWCESRFGPNTITDRVRIDPTTDCVLSVEQLTVEDIENDLSRLFYAKKDMLLNPFLNIVKIINEFPPNDYMLRHQPKHNQQAMVYVKSDDRSSSNITIANIYESLSQGSEIVPWNPIDDQVCTVIHRQSNVMPCAFPPWGKNLKEVNDRTSVLEKAEKKNLAKKDEKKKRLSMIKWKKKKRRKEEKQKSAAQIAKCTFEGESLDPDSFL